MYTNLRLHIRRNLWGAISQNITRHQEFRLVSAQVVLGLGEQDFRCHFWCHIFLLVPRYTCSIYIYHDFSYISSYIQIALEAMLLIILIVDICSGSFIFTYILIFVCVIFIGASLSEPHTSQLNGAIFIYISVVRIPYVL